MAKSTNLRTAALPLSVAEYPVDTSLQEYLSLLEAVPYGFLLIDASGTIQACNSVARSMFQYRNVDLAGMGIEILFSKSDKEFFYENLQSCREIIATPAKYTSTELDCLRKDKTLFPVEINLKTIALSGRELIGCTIRDISLRRFNESSIWKKEEKLQLALQGAELWIWEFRYETSTISYELQKSASSAAGNSEIDLSFDNWLELIHPDHRTDVLGKFSKLKSGELRRFEAEYKVKRHNGAWDWIYTCGKVSKYDAEGRPEIAGGTNLNISERKYAEERLQEKNDSLFAAEQRLRLAQECGGVASWERDLESRYLTYYSDNLASLYGLDSPENIRTLEGLLDSTHPDDRESVLQKVESAKKNEGAQFFLEYRVIWPDGSVHWLTSQAMITCDSDNVPAKITGTLFDITAKKNAVEELKESEERFRSAFNQSAIPMLLVSKDESIFRVNQAMCMLTRYTESELLNMNLMDLVHPGDRDYTEKHMRKAVNGSIEKFSTESRYCTRTDEIKWVSANVVSIKDEQNCFRYAVVQLQDITKEHNLSTRLIHEATHDNLTGLVNRREFENRLITALEKIKQEKSKNALAYLDLDQFKVINDICGHAAGDELLRQLSVLIANKLRKEDIIARLGGDEFGLFMQGCDLHQANLIMQKIHRLVSDFRFFWDDKFFNVTISSGLVAITDESLDIIEVLKQADAACYAAKDAGRDRLHVFHPQDEELSRRSGEMQWVARINRALEEDRFQLYCQPIAAVEAGSTGRLYYEILLRLQEENGDLVPPGAFLPAAERYGLSTRLDKWVIKKTLNWLQMHPRHVENLDLCCINLSGHSLGDQEVLDFIEMQFEKNLIPANKICFEITETAAIANLSNATNFIKSLKSHGCLFALDDFGSGLSSFAYLKTLEVDILKIDGTFVREIVTDPVDLAMVRSINEIGKVLGKRTTAEFVENDEILAILREIGVDRAQGYGISRPIPIEDLSAE
ncbi:MAG: diguanylate cyclase (GGDEF)-like protein/PAS domain S-box-containing protein [Gammaproteobacteria bacterium]